jgi:hypothetical protein
MFTKNVVKEAYENISTNILVIYRTQSHENGDRKSFGMDHQYSLV